MSRLNFVSNSPRGSSLAPSVLLLRKSVFTGLVSLRGPCVTICGCSVISSGSFTFHSKQFIRDVFAVLSRSPGFETQYFPHFD